MSTHNCLLGSSSGCPTIITLTRHDQLISYVMDGMLMSSQDLCGKAPEPNVMILRGRLLGDN